jgi:hypothetical protein
MYLKKRAKMRREGERRDVFERYIGEISKAVSAITEDDTKKLYEALLKQARERTAIADRQLNDEGKTIKEDPADQEGVLIITDASEAPAIAPPLARAGALQTAVDDEPAKAASTGKTKQTSKSAKAAAKVLTTRSKKTRDDDDGGIFRASKAETAALKVAALANDDDEDDSPMPRKRQSKAAEPSKPEPSKPEPKKRDATKPEIKKPEPNKSESKRDQPPAKVEKPRVRLVNGKPVPIDQPRLF